MENVIAIVGYEQEGHCEHCGRALKHCIRIGDGRIVGATCFDKKLTKPVFDKYRNKSYRLGAEQIIRFAKMAQFWSAERMAREGVYGWMLQFEQA